MAYLQRATDTGEPSLFVPADGYGLIATAESSHLQDIKPRINELVDPERNQADIKPRINELAESEQNLSLTSGFSLDDRVKVNSDIGLAGRSIFSGASNFDSLRKRRDAREVRELESSVLGGEIFLETISPVLVKEAEDFPEFGVWIKQIEKLREMKKTPQVRIGLYGVTGAGKSTLINALLGRQLLHCNAMRAGTAAVTEIMYNDEDKYRGEIELVSVEEWEQELKVLLSDLREYSTTNNCPPKNKKADQAAIAWAKVTAVYPHLEWENLVGMTVSEVLAQQDLQNFLGATKVFEEKSLSIFSKILKQYTNSTSQQSLEAGKKASDTPFWPFVKRATIKLKAVALETGVVLYDLPGCGDTNAARAQIAERFMENLDRIWVLADINRACDDAIAKNLLGAPFRRQLKMDGNYNDEHVTFIMTKTDNITCDDVIQDLELADQLYVEQSRIDRLSKHLSRLTKEIEVKSTRSKQTPGKQRSITKTINSINRDQSHMDNSRPYGNGASDRELRYLKRKHSNVDNEHPVSLPLKVEKSRTEGGPRLRNQDQLPSQIADLVAKQREIHQFQGQWQKDKHALVAKKEKVDKELKEQLIMLKRICIEKRNKYAIDRIRDDFAVGQNECEREFADDDEREVLAGSSKVLAASAKLQVFAVSSKAFLMLSKKLRREADLDGLYTEIGTSIPELQLHCRNTTLKRRGDNAFTYIKALEAMQTEIQEWAQDQSTDNQISPEQRGLLKDLLSTELSLFSQRVSEGLDVLIKRYREAVIGPIFRGLKRSVPYAVIEAKTAVESWTAGGLAHATWKAICVRLGAFANSREFRYDWNEQLAEPFFTHFQGPWDETFNKLFPELKQSHLDFVQLAMNELAASLKGSSARISAATCRPLENVLGQFQSSNAELEMDFTAAFEEIKKVVNGIHRRLKPYIQSQMTATYNYGSAEKGKGCFSRCKSHMANYMDEDGQSMYTNAERVLKRALEATCDDLRAKIQSAVDATCQRIGASYDGMLAASMTDEPLVVRAAKRQFQIWMMEKLAENQDGKYNHHNIDFEDDINAIKAEFDREIIDDEEDNYEANSNSDGIFIDDCDDYSGSEGDADSFGAERDDLSRSVDDGDDESRGLGLLTCDERFTYQDGLPRPATSQPSYLSHAEN